MGKNGRRGGPQFRGVERALGATGETCTKKRSVVRGGKGVVRKT